MDQHRFHVGTAGWSIPARHAAAFAPDGSHLQRYADVLPAVEINSSFYRPHRRETYERWAASTPDAFRFAVKIPRTITHEHRLSNTRDLLNAFLDQAGGLGGKFGVLLVQLPPKLPFDAATTEAFFDMLRQSTDVDIACEPRHASWFEAEADDLWRRFRIARVAADPSGNAGGGTPSGWPELAYFRLHGAPRIYYSDYPADKLAEIRTDLQKARKSAGEVWCIFDNTAGSHALGNALTLAADLD